MTPPEAQERSGIPELIVLIILALFSQSFVDWAAPTLEGLLRGVVDLVT
jgi:hypothetical protein